MAEERPPNQVPVVPVAVVAPSRYNFRAAAVVGFIVGVIDVLIAIRFFMKLLGASSESSFVTFIYGVTAPLVAPFHGIFPNSGSGANIFESGSLVALVVYALIGWGIVALIRIVTAPRGTRPSNS